MRNNYKTKKALSKRIKITGADKIMKRPPGQGHFNSKDSGNASRRKHGDVSAPSELYKKVKHLIFN